MMLTRTISTKQISRNVSVKCVCDMRKKYEATISARAKENVNQLLVLGTTDFKNLMN